MRAWEVFVHKLTEEIGQETADKWLHTLVISHFDAGNIYLEARDSFHAMWFEEHIRKKTLTGLMSETGRPIKVHLSVSNTPAPVPEVKKRTVVSRDTPKPIVIEADALDPNMTLETIVGYEGNLLTLRLMAELVSGETELGAFNPIYVCGGKGTGKTHFLQAAASGLAQRGLRCFYVRGDTFMEHVVSAIRADKMTLFRDAYRNVDVLFVDDVGILSGKGATQEEFFHTFNTLHLAGKQIVLSALCAPQELEEIAPRLISRFEWGIVLPLERQQEKELAQILARKAEVLQFPMSKALSGYLLETFGTSATTLVRALETLVLRVHMNSKAGYLPSTAVEVPLAKHLLSDLVKREERALLTPEKVIETVAEHFSMPVGDLIGKSQSREIVMPRKIAMHLCRTRLSMPFKKIGKLFSRDHSTVMSSVGFIDEALQKKEPQIAPPYQKISKQLVSFAGEQAP